MFNTKQREGLKCHPFFMPLDFSTWFYFPTCERCYEAMGIPAMEVGNYVDGGLHLYARSSCRWGNVHIPEAYVFYPSLNLVLYLHSQPHDTAAATTWCYYLMLLITWCHSLPDVAHYLMPLGIIIMVFNVCIQVQAPWCKRSISSLTRTISKETAAQASHQIVKSLCIYAHLKPLWNRNKSPSTTSSLLCLNLGTLLQLDQSACWAATPQILSTRFSKGWASQFWQNSASSWNHCSWSCSWAA